MKIIDKNGNWVEVTDLIKAIQQTGWYKEYLHAPTNRNRQGKTEILGRYARET